MPTDTIDLPLDGLTDSSLREKLASIEKSNPRLVQLLASKAKLKMIQQAVCSLRASGISTILTLNKEGVVSGDQARETLETLYACDQLSLKNLTAVLGDQLPEDAVRVLESEAKIESLWMREWLAAKDDERLSKVPSLPWRSFIRKITSENLRFGLDVTDVLEGKPTDQDGEFESKLAGLMKTFFTEKKKVVCMFPKRGGNA